MLNKKDEKIIKSLEKQENIKIDKNNIENLKEKIYNRYCSKAKEIEEGFKTRIQSKLLFTIDDNWIDHLETMEDIKTNMELRVYGGYDPIGEYKIEGRKEFEFLIYKIRMNFICGLLFDTNYI